MGGLKPLDTLTKILLVACLILAGALGFTIGMLTGILQEDIIHPSNNTITNVKNNNLGNVSHEKANTSKSTEWDVHFCPYCGSPFAYVDEVPRYIDANGIMHGDIYRVYECGHRVYMGEKTWRFYNFKPEVQEYEREYIKERGGEVYY